MVNTDGACSHPTEPDAPAIEKKPSVVVSVVVLLSSVLLQLLFSEKDSISGVFIAYLANNYGLPAVFTTTLVSCHTGIAYLGAFPSGLLLIRLGVTRMLIVGSLLTCGGYISSAFLPSFPALIFTFGLVSGLGLSAFQVVSIYLVQQHFESKRALAQGIASAGQAIGQFLWPPLLEWLIALYGWRGAFLITAGIHLQVCIIAIVLKLVMLEMKISEIKAESSKHSDLVDKLESYSQFHKTNVDKEINLTKGVDNPAFETASSLSINQPFFDKRKKYNENSSAHQQDSTPSEQTNGQKLKHLLTNMFFNLYCLSFFFLLFGHEVPYLWLPTAGNASGASAQASAFLVSINGIASGIFRVFWGFISDFATIRKYRSIIMCISIVLTGAASMLLVLMTTYDLLVLYAVLQGIFSGYYYALCYTVCVDFSGKEYINLANPILIATFGISVLVSSPFAGWLVEVFGDTDLAVLVAGGIQLVGGVQLLIADVWRQKHGQNIAVSPT